MKVSTKLPESSASARASLRLRSAGDGRLWAVKGAGAEVAVNLRRCFPWSQPHSWLSLRNDAGEEYALIETLEDLDPDSRLALLKVVEEAAFVFEVEALVAIDDEFELRQWRVRTKQGERVFQTRMNVWPRELSGGGLLIQDVANDLYLIPDPARLDPASQKKLWAFLDDDQKREATRARSAVVVDCPRPWRLKLLW